MSAPIGSEGRPVDVPSMYAPRWARDAATDAAEAALAASEKLRRALPPAPLLEKPEARPRWREPKPFEGDVAIQRLRRPSLDPVPVPAPPMREPGSGAGMLARAFGAVGIAALAAFFIVGTAPLSLAVKAEDEGATASFWSRFVVPASTRQQPAQNSRISVASAETIVPVTLTDRFAAVGSIAERAPAPPPVKMVAVLPALPPFVSPAPADAASPEPTPAAQPLGREEIALLYRRGEELIAQGDIAAARLMFARAAEAGDARAALALGAAYDPDVLKRLGVFGVVADAALAREWYEKAVTFGSGEASKRIELLAQGR